ncbi:ParB/RepB/Spo0J family partition protein [Thermopolyspora sp. NPDC052614]|uniref:ParB/RepB/Spo0J family partition protein n=1 Tax=Thermopolyspora sp. NPDC052614 TaxID=3155682 RepID=UPI003418E6E2
MSNRPRRGLGKGLGALIPTGPIVQPSAQPEPADPEVAPGFAPAPVPVAGAYFQEIDVELIDPNPRQPREIFDGEALDELAMSIEEVGLLQPIVVRAKEGGRFELIMGERRLRASKLAGLKQIPSIVRNTQDDEMLREALIENLQREQLNPLEEAAAYRQLLDDFGATHEQLARKVGRSRPHITNTLRLLTLPPSIHNRLASGLLSAGHARALLTLDDPAAQEHLAKRIVAEQLSVRAVEEIVQMGEATAGRAPRQRAPKQPPTPALKDLSDRLSDLFETRVKVDLGKTKGRIVVEFASVDDLERILSSMAPDAIATMRSSSE